MDSIDDIVSGIGAEADIFLGGEAPAEPANPAPAPVEEQPPVTEPVSNDAAPAADVAAEPPVDPSPVPAPEPEPAKPAWETDDNPYFKRASQLEQALQKAAENVQQKQMAEEMAARQRLIDNLPNMDPDQARRTVFALQQWDAQQAETRVKQVEAEYEPFVKELLVHRLGTKLSLTADERKELEQWNDPKQLTWAAQQIAQNRKQRETETSEIRKQMAELQLRVQAQERIQSPVDRVAVGAGGSTAHLQDANSIDDIVAGLNLGDWMRS